MTSRSVTSILSHFAAGISHDTLVYASSVTSPCSNTCFYMSRRQKEERKRRERFGGFVFTSKRAVHTSKYTMHWKYAAENPLKHQHPILPTWHVSLTTSYVTVLHSHMYGLQINRLVSMGDAALSNRCTVNGYKMLSSLCPWACLKKWQV